MCWSPWLLAPETFHSHSLLGQSNLKQFVSSAPLILRSIIFKIVNDASLSIFYQYLHASCSLELTNGMPPPLLWLCCTKFSTPARPYAVQMGFVRVNQYFYFCIHFTGDFRKSLRLSVFLFAFYLNSLKMSVMAPHKPKLIICFVLIP